MDAKSLSRERFSRYAAGYVSSPTHAAGSGLDRLLDIVRPQPHWRVLDVATGGGHTALLFAPRVASVVASDLTPEMLKAAERHLCSRGATNVTFELADAENLPFEAEQFDLVTCRLAAHHFPAPMRFMYHAVRVLRPGGVILVQDQMVPDDPVAAAFINEFERLRDPSHKEALQRARWQGLLEEVGLTIRNVVTLAQRHGLADWAERQGCSSDTTQQLGTVLESATSVARAWLEPFDVGTASASFLIHQIIICGEKPA